MRNGESAEAGMVEETRAAIALGASFLATIVVVPVMKQVALAIGLVDLPSSRKVHQRPMPYLGGLAISFGTVAALMAVAGLTAPSRWLVLGAVGVGTIGLLDDHRSLSPKLRLGGEFVFAGMVAWSGTRLAVTGDTVIDAGISAFVLVALTNALNLCDNMDGLAAGL
ncbi:MAG: glycosyltransferase family 4 protein, partial [Acidimicrobiia bacterium]